MHEFSELVINFLSFVCYNCFWNMMESFRRHTLAASGNFILLLSSPLPSIAIHNRIWVQFVYKF